METSQQATLQRAAFYLACGCAVAGVVSIAASHILLAAALLTLMVSRPTLRLPRIWIPLSLFLLGTLLSIAVSADPRAGLPQVKKLYVYLMLVAIYNTVRTALQGNALVYWWGAAASVAAIRGIQQFIQKTAAHKTDSEIYRAYVADRITGFMGHWMTFSGLQMIAFLMLMSVLIFAPPRDTKWRLAGAAAASLIAVSIVLSGTRSVWLAVAASSVFLVLRWRARWLLALPVLAGITLIAGPQWVRDRALSIYKPHGNMDSNQHRYVTTRTGWEMIKAHPLAGVGPQLVGRTFEQYVPPDIQKPLPIGYYDHLHSIYVHYAAERGVPVMLALVAMLIMILWDLGRGAARWMHNGPRRAVLEGALAVVIAIMIEGFFELNLGDSEVLAMFLAVVALGYIAAEPETERKANV